LFSSHILAEVAAICDRLLILHHGRLLADKTVRELRDQAENGDSSLERAVLEVIRQGESAK
jgi:sodium transport system ATP-binding protein